jgi:cytidine deaminase
MTESAVNWALLRESAIAATQRSYAPYSHVLVGAAGVNDQGELVVGSNVENASYGLTLCAECSLTSDLVRLGGGRLVAISIVAGDHQPIAPCGRCRQVLFEFGGADLLIDQGPGADPITLKDLLPQAFGPADLPARRS